MNLKIIFIFIFTLICTHQYAQSRIEGGYISNPVKTDEETLKEEECPCEKKKLNFSTSYIFKEIDFVNYYSRGYSGYGNKSCFIGACTINGSPKFRGGSMFSFYLGYHITPKWETGIGFNIGNSLLEAYKGQIKSFFYGVDSSDYIYANDKIKIFNFPLSVSYNIPLCNNEKRFSTLSFSLGYVPQRTVLNHHVKIYQEDFSGNIETTIYNFENKYFRSAVLVGGSLKIHLGNTAGFKFSVFKFIGSPIELDKEIYYKNASEYIINKREILFNNLNLSLGINISIL